MTASIKELWRRRRLDRKRAYSKGARAVIIIFRLLYTILLIFSLFYGNLYINLLVLAITAILLMSDVKLFFARFLVRVTKLKNKNYKALKGSKVTIRTEVKNNFIFTYPVCRLYIEKEEGIIISEEFDEKIIFGLSSFTKNTLWYTLYCPFRGQYNVGSDMMHIYDDLGISYIRKKVNSRILLTVYPDVFSIGDFDDIKRREEEKLGVITKETMDYSDSMEIRDYREQDSLRNIHWKVSSRLDKLMTKKYFASQSSRLCLFFDNSIPLNFIQDNMERLSVIDKLSEACATVCKFLNSERIPFEFIYSEGKELNSSLCDTENDFEAVYYLIASLKFNEYNSDSHPFLAEYISRSENPRNCVYIFTLNLTEKILYSIKELNYLGFSSAVIYVCNEHADAILTEKVKSLCVKFMTLHVGDDTALSLEAF